MAAILCRLESIKSDFHPFCTDDTKKWTFTRLISEKNTIFFRDLVQNHSLLSFEYNVHCTQLAHSCLRFKKDDINDLTRQFEAALMMAELLEHIHHYYLNTPQEVARLASEQDLYRQWLTTQGYQFNSNEKKKISVEPSLINTIREFTASANWPRLVAVRTRRLLVSISVMAEGFDRYRYLISSMDIVARPVLTYLSWMVFAPRLAANLLLTFNRVIPGHWMKPQERELGWQTRLQIQWQGRWFEFGNDAVWLASGLLNCFVLTGTLAPLSPYLSIMLQAYDVVLACLRNHIETGRLQTIQMQHEAMLKQPNLSTDKRRQIESHIAHLQTRISYEQRRYYLGIVNASLLLLSISFTLPALAAYPILPVFGASIAVMTTILFAKTTQWLEKQKPVDRLRPSMTTQGFFKCSTLSSSESKNAPNMRGIEEKMDGLKP